MGDNLSTIDLGSERAAMSISAASLSSCAVLDDNSVKCWGRNNRGQLGLGDTDDRGDAAGEMGDDLPAVDLGNEKTARGLSVGGDPTGSPNDGFACALLDNGDPSNAGGIILTGNWDREDTDNLGDDPNEMGDDLTAVNLGDAERTATMVSVGNFHACALLDDNSIKCWGRNNYGQLGLGDANLIPRRCCW